MNIVGKKVADFDLRTVYDARDSFYGKAFVEEYSDGGKVLTSYRTKVLYVNGKGKAVRLFTSEDVMSQTTCRHCKEFLMQFADFDELDGKTVKEKVMNLPYLEVND